MPYTPQQFAEWLQGAGRTLDQDQWNQLAGVVGAPGADGSYSDAQYGQAQQWVNALPAPAAQEPFFPTFTPPEYQGPGAFDPGPAYTPTTYTPPPIYDLGDADRIKSRKELLRGLESNKLDHERIGKDWTDLREKAYDAMTRVEGRQAFELKREPAARSPWARISLIRFFCVTKRGIWYRFWGCRLRNSNS